MRLIKITLIIFIVSTVTTIYGQNKLIYLKDSSAIHGEILNRDKYNIMVKAGNEVKKIPKSEILDIYYPKSEVTKYPVEISYFNISDIGLLAGKREEKEKYSLSFNLVNGIQIDNRISLGLGMGIEFMDINLIPLFGDLRWYANKGNTQFFIGFQGGYVFPLEPSYYELQWDDYNYKKGTFYSPLIGLKTQFKESRNGFIISAGFKHMKISGERSDNWQQDSTYEREFIYDRFSFRIGYYFN